MNPISHLDHKLRQGQLILLDGATGTELERRGVPMNHKAWSATALLSHPQLVQAVHEDYLRAGVEVLTANSFSTAKHMLLPAGLADRFRELNTRAICLAARARERAATGPVAIAGSISPTSFTTASTQGYPPPSEAYSWYSEQADLLAEAGADLLLIEMIEDLEHGAPAVEAACRVGLPVWLGFSCRIGREGEVLLLKGEDPLATAVEALTPLCGSAALIMHTEVADAAAALRVLQAAWSGPSGVYAHSGRFVMPNWQFNDIITPPQYCRATSQWIELGASIIGGCCGVGPAHIAMLRRRFFPPKR